MEPARVGLHRGCGSDVVGVVLEALARPLAGLVVITAIIGACGWEWGHGRDGTPFVQDLSRRYSSVRPYYSFDSIDAKSIAMSARNGASGRLSVKRTV